MPRAPTRDRDAWAVGRAAVWGAAPTHSRHPPSLRWPPCPRHPRGSTGGRARKTTTTARLSPLLLSRLTCATRAPSPARLASPTSASLRLTIVSKSAASLSTPSRAAASSGEGGGGAVARCRTRRRGALHGPGQGVVRAGEARVRRAGTHSGGFRGGAQAVKNKSEWDRQKSPTHSLAFRSACVASHTTHTNTNGHVASLHGLPDHVPAGSPRGGRPSRRRGARRAAPRACRTRPRARRRRAVCQRAAVGGSGE